MSLSETALTLLDVRLPADVWPVILALPTYEKVALSFLLSTTSASLRCSEWQEKNEQCFYQQNQTLQVENDRIYERYKALMRLGDFYLTALCRLLSN